MNLPLRKGTTPDTAEFYRRSPENLLLVQGTSTGRVLVRATADNLTPEQQEAFIRYLQAEGFMAAGSDSPDRFGAWKLNRDMCLVRWIVDASWPDVDPAYALHLRRLSLCTLGIVVVWLAVMTVLVCC